MIRASSFLGRERNNLINLMANCLHRCFNSIVGFPMTFNPI